MSKVAIITDSNSGITQAEGEKLGIKVVPMPFTIAGTDYLEDINLTQEEFYTKLSSVILWIYGTRYSKNTMRSFISR